MQIPKIEFKLDEYKKLGDKVLEEARKYSKEAANSVIEYQNRIQTLVLDLQAGNRSPESARISIGRYNRAIVISLAAAKEKMNWTIARTYWEANRHLIDFIITSISTLVAAL